MDVATFCNEYQRKMWSSMISRKKMNFNIWDAIYYAREKVYYMPYSGKSKFEVKTRFCKKCNSELIIGFRKNEFITKTCKCSLDNKNYATLEKLETIFDKEKSQDILKMFNSQKTVKFPNKMKFWLDQGFTDEEAVLKIKNIQLSRSKQSPSTQPGVREYSVRCKEYWLRQGYSESESEDKVKEYQIKNGLDWYLNKYGESGKDRYYSRLDQWLKTLQKTLENDPTINERKMVKLSRASKLSLKLFLPLYDEYNEKYKIYLGMNDNSEYFLRGNNSIFFYDFTIPELKIIVEFNGSAFHPNRNLMNEQQWNEWKCLFSDAPADSVNLFDEAKQKLAETYGYTVIKVWDTDNLIEARNKIKNLIEVRRGY